ncbi:gamma-glutamylcyclotransferase [Dyadobacter sp. CY326]|uniref:gamma-glutamylcyclotransferase family protein n=1 Tax=Dyadobacter sp. CY326 TaxID=2907300 RepID=UPI001F2910E7|nr:gamma-glutamylcyclotransferase family protein [Dyadobacter sp. CY326]MCE7067322.1 gamma-glutamylcyclotransferase [Dyadobacter sp. CY326]
MEKFYNLFTYGTLMQNFENPFAERLRSNSVFEGRGYFPGFLYLISWFPGAIYEPATDSKVHGEIYRLSSLEALLVELDDYEDVFEDEKSSLYLRKTISITRENDDTIDCWVYLYNQSVANLPLIADGHFRG